MDQNEVGRPGSQPGKSVGDGILSFFSAADDGDDLTPALPVLGPAFPGRKDENELIHFRMAGDRFQARFEHGFPPQEGELLGGAEAPAGSGGDDDGRDLPHRASSLYRPKIIFPTVVWSTEVTVISTFWPIIRRELSTTTIVPSSR